MLTRCSGYGFPATFGFVFAAIIGVIVIRLLVLRESRNERNTSDACGECGVVEQNKADDK